MEPQLPSLKPTPRFPSRGLAGGSWMPPTGGWALGAAVAVHAAVFALALAAADRAPAGGGLPALPTSAGFVMDEAFVVAPTPERPREDTAEVDTRETPVERTAPEIPWPPLAPGSLTPPPTEALDRSLAATRPFTARPPARACRRKTAPEPPAETPVIAMAKAPAPERPAPPAPRTAPTPGSGTGGTTAPRPIAGAQPPPLMPARADERGWFGTAVLRLAIDEKGAVSGARIVRSSGHAILDRAALRAVKRWRFEPARRGGRPVAGSHLAAVRFPRR